MTTQENAPIQRILFGPPGSGKSFRARKIGEELNAKHTIQATFHPAYDYGDFVVKLLPMTVRRIREFHVADRSENAPSQKYEIKTPIAESSIEYRVHVGHLIRAVAKALEVGPNENVLLIIDEINRGDCARIFGDMFQLLDRDASGWSSYGVNLSELAFAGLMKALGWTCEDNNGALRWSKDDANWNETELPNGIWGNKQGGVPKLASLFGQEPVLRLPPNLSIVGTMNTSDESVYYMDTAFKRRWGFEFINWNYGKLDDETIKAQREALLEGTDQPWGEFLEKLNGWIASEATQRRIDDKQVGLWFLKRCPCGLASLYDAFAKAAEIPSPTPTQWYEIGLEDAPITIRQWKEGGSSYERDEIARWDAGLGEFIKDRLATGGSKIFEQLEAINQSDNEKDPSPKLAAMRLMSCDWNLFISAADIRFKLMHFLWDNVFSRDKAPLESLIFGKGQDKKLRTFDDFVARHKEFIDAIMKLKEEPQTSTEAADSLT